MLSNNLLKGAWVQYHDDETRVIKSSEAVEKRLFGQEAPERAPEPEDTEDAPEPGEFQGGLQAEELEGLLADPDDETTVFHAQQSPPAPVYDGPSPEELIAQAEDEIRRMREDAQAEIEAAKKWAVEESRKAGREQGYHDGMSAAQAEADQRQRSLEDSYQEKLREMEPALVKELAGIYEHIFHVGLGEYQDLVMRLLDHCMQKIEGGGDYIVHVSPADYPFVSIQKTALLEEMGNKNATLEVVEDAALRKNECMIETEGGIYDCSLDVQLAALRRELLLLSYESAE